MANIKKYETQKGVRYLVQVRKAGYPPKSRSFTSLQEAERWAAVTEGRMASGEHKDVAPLLSNTMRDMLSEWEPHARKMKSWENDLRFRLRMWRGEGDDDLARFLKALCDRPISKIDHKDFVEFADMRRAAGVSEATIKNDLAVILSAWRRFPETMHLPCPAKAVSANLKPSVKRSRRLKPLEKQYLLEELQNTKCSDQNRQNKWMQPVFLFALATAARMEEIVSIRWDDVDFEKKTARLLHTKNGHVRYVPLSPAALQVIEKIREQHGEKEGEKVFQTTTSAIKQSFQRALKRARSAYKLDNGEDDDFLVDFRFHDLRHESISTWAMTFQTVAELMLVSGHRDARSLFRYVNTAQEEAAKIAERMQRTIS